VHVRNRRLRLHADDVLGAVMRAWVCTLLAACSTHALPTIDADNAVAPSDPLYRGQYQFLYDTWGTEVLATWPPSEFMLGLMTSEPDVFGDQFSSFGFIPDDNDDLPIGLKRGIADPSKVHETCSMCHTARLPDGRLWMGMPNEHLDIGRFTVEVNQRWVAAGNPSLVSDLELTKLGELGPGRAQADSDDYPTVVPADFPSYFTLAQRTATNYLGTGRNLRTESSLSIYTFGAGNTDLGNVPFPDESRLASFLDFFGQLAPPDPPAQDPASVAAGQTVFMNAGCAQCHHPDDIGEDGVVTYVDASQAELEPGSDATYPRGTISTDPAHRSLEDGTGGDAGYLDLLEFVQDQHLQVTGTDGYRVNDLRGVWASAPYLHDGSVPTLQDLLAPPSQRPQTWSHDDFAFDASVLGNGAGGHAFGATLSDGDKASLIAYLDSL
jgi:mono/diheme cytochrome c family protein